jgi:hypothetical protein
MKSLFRAFAKAERKRESRGLLDSGQLRDIAIFGSSISSFDAPVPFQLVQPVTDLIEAVGGFGKAT